MDSRVQVYVCPLDLAPAIEKNVRLHLHETSAEGIRGKSSYLRVVGMHASGIVIHPPISVVCFVSRYSNVMARIRGGAEVHHNALKIVRYAVKLDCCIGLYGVQQSSRSMCGTPAIELYYEYLWKGRRPLSFKGRRRGR